MHVKRLADFEQYNYKTCGISSFISSCNGFILMLDILIFFSIKQDLTFHKDNLHEMSNPDFWEK